MVLYHNMLLFLVLGSFLIAARKTAFIWLKVDNETGRLDTLPSLWLCDKTIKYISGPGSP